MPSKAELTRVLRAHVRHNLFDESGVTPAGIAVYALADPRELRAVRYVGQSSDPRRRLLQHLNSARLWLPDERPWWIKDPRLRPLYAWIRSLYQDGRRLPSMLVSAWVEPTQARQAERDSIYRHLSQCASLFNVEAERGGAQLQLL